MARTKHALLTWVFVLAFFVSSASSVGQDAPPLYRRMQAALGGRERIASIRDFEECVSADSWDDSAKSHGVVYKRTRWIKPAVLRLDQVGVRDTYVLFFDGTSGWEILPDKGFADLAGDELNFARGYASGVDIKLWLADEDRENVVTSSGKDVISIAEKSDRSHRLDITLDTTTFLPQSESSVSLTDPTHPVVTQTRQFEDWATFQGLKFPRRIINFHHERKVADVRVLRFTLDSRMQIKDLALKPENLKPHMSGCGTPK